MSKEEMESILNSVSSVFKLMSELEGRVETVSKLLCSSGIF